jgi:ADP-ribose pyrophosphatase YjhB (NUDIX family)
MSKQVRIRVAAIIVQDQTVLMVKHAKDGREYWMLPGGGVDFGESLSEALVRELKEEVCIDVKPRELVLANDSIPPDKHRHIINLYFLADLVGGTAALGEDPRIVEVAYIPLRDLNSVTMFPDIGPELLRLLQNDETHPMSYLGNLWQD